MSKITVSKDKCVGCGACVSSYPELFELDPAGQSQVKAHNYADFNYGREEIETICPVGAIKVED